MSGDPSALHERVLFMASSEGDDVCVLCFADPGGALALHRALRARLEGSLLGELSRASGDLRERPSRIASARLVLFADVPEIEGAVRAFGMSRATPADARWRSILARARGEASSLGRAIPDEPASVWEAQILTTADARAIESRLLEITTDVFGSEPGAPFARLVRAAADRGLPPIAPTLAGLDALERALVPTGERAIRWVPPLAFQALADGVGVVASTALGRRVAWAECAPDDDGAVPPPMLRVEVPGGDAHVPIGLELLRFSVMPRLAGEEIPPLSRFVERLFTNDP